jgi:hypothetical protein
VSLVGGRGVERVKFMWAVGKMFGPGTNYASAVEAH